MRRKIFSHTGVMIGLSLLITLGVACAPLLTVTEAASTPIPENTPTASAPVATGSELFREPHPILGEVRVRQAIAYCTDRAALIRSVYPWLADPAPFIADSFVPRGHWAYAGNDAGFVHYPFDPGRGRVLLEEAGWIVGDAEYRVNSDGEELAWGVYEGK